MRAKKNTVSWQVLSCIGGAALLSACASGPPSYEQNIQSAISGSGNVWVSYVGTDVVVLHGWIDDLYSRNAVIRAASEGDDGRKVINRIAIQPGNRR